MSHPEQLAWENLRPVLVGLDPHRVENIVGPGHPDVSYAGGDIELKALAGWPAGEDTPVRLPEFTGEQAGWLAQRWLARGRAFLAVRVGRVWFFFDGHTALEVRAGLTKRQWNERCVFRSIAGWNVVSRKLLRSWLLVDLDRMGPCDRARAMRLIGFKDGCRPKSIEEAAEEQGWTPERLLLAETVYSLDTDVLLSFWES